MFGWWRLHGLETISVEDMRIADENSEYLGVPRSLLMENAGRGILEKKKKSRRVKHRHSLRNRKQRWRRLRRRKTPSLGGRQTPSLGGRQGALNPAGRPRQNSHPRGPAKLESPRKNETHSGKNPDRKHLRPQKTRKNNRERRRCG